MRALHIKLGRDLLHMWPQLLAIAAVIAAGVAVCITMLSALASLQTSRDAYYAGSQFADIFATVKRAPESAVQRLRELNGVEIVESRIVADVTVDVPQFAEPVVGRLVSIPDTGTAALNQLLLRSGAYPDAARGDEVLASESFARAHRLRPGDSIAAVVNGRWKRLTIAGVALSPEYVYSIRAGDLFPDDKRFGAFWMRRRELAAAFDLDGAFNNAVIRVSRDAQVDSVIEDVDRVLTRYGGLGAVARKDQTSAWYLENELAQLSNMGRVTPFIFAAVAAFLLHLVITRLVATQREQIGVLKAFGYSNAAIARHYVGFVLAITVVGVALGIGVGAWAGAEWTRMYALFFRFPDLRYTLPTSVVVVAALAAAGIGTTASLAGARRAASVPPAEAMRPLAPATYRRGILEWVGVQRFVPLTLRIVVRNLERRPARALFSVLAIALAVAIVIVGIFTVDAVHYLTDVQFNRAQRQDVTVVFKDARSRRALHELTRLPGVLRAEPMRVVAVRLRNGHLSRRIGLLGLDGSATLARVIDEQLQPVSLPNQGIVLNDALAAALRLERGQAITIEVLEGSRPTRTTVVSRIVTEYLGLAAYADLRALNRLLGEGAAISGGYLQVDATATPDLYRDLKTTPGIASITLSNVARVSFEETLAAVINTVTAMFAAFGAAIAFAVIYNNNRIAFAERARELGSLHVLGFTHVELAEILLGEMVALTVVGLPLGVLAGHLLGAAVVVLFSTELARIPLVIAPATSGAAVSITVIAALFSAVAMWRQLARLDLVSVLKAPE